ncbi:hypothetical protein ACFE04_007903 [Oxalis oulophora]
MLGGIGSTMASMFFIYTMFQKYFPRNLQIIIDTHFRKLTAYFYPYVEITFHEYPASHFQKNEAYTAIENYLSSKSTDQATRFKAETLKKDSKSLVFSLEDHEEVTDEYRGVTLFWTKIKTVPNTQTILLRPAPSAHRYYKVSFHKHHRKLVTGDYIQYVLSTGREIGAKNRQRKLYTNSSDTCSRSYSGWSHVVFDHPASFETLAMNPRKKKEIMDDLERFSKAKEYYARIGKAWKRGYLLYGPPGTGKSTMIAAIANFLNYDIYDLELTAVKDNTVLRKLFIETSSKSIIVIEDIDCSLDLTGQREETSTKDKCKEENPQLPLDKEKQEKGQNVRSKVTLSGLLNVIDGIWSSSGGDRLVIFTTNYVEKLDKALVRKGRMDKHIELSYCDFEGFKVLAKNYLSLETHELFDTVRVMLEEVNTTPADVAENLMPKSILGDPDTCLESLVCALKKAKEQAMVKAEEDKVEKADENAEKETLTAEEKIEENPAAEKNEEESSVRSESESSEGSESGDN